MEMTNTKTTIECPENAGREAFTLAELLVVVAIMAIVIGMAIPAFQGIGRGVGMRAAVVQMRTTLSLARQWAITHRQRTYVVFPGLNDPNRISGYTVFATNRFATGSGSYAYVKDWSYLPKGVVIHFANSDLQTALRFPNPTNTSQQIIADAVIFLPDGTIDGSGGSYGARILLAEGWANAVTNVGGSASPDYGLVQGGVSQLLRVATHTGSVKAGFSVNP